ncbi:uncharacterized protein C8Q71DRAFT_794860 [Rhodofomes roseus]|uniref:Uncharacterized protein n=1 Tax=Rhodofomes roseus TaxID=34475 RepID=A0ABQ8KS74_9APHY|nr:uncharacterized protein C8Q71DRAFT_794860 [Rhodofomes roseus]KAH9840789.1 hypothetical protein C8Q71DRAFT_794860 [Rhodofomes roseus]
MPRGQPYIGTTRKLVLAIDVGTTYSGVSYCILTPGEIPKVHSITRFPGQEGEDKSRDTKIPSVVYYDDGGKVRAVGAEACLDSTRVEAQENGWTLVEWFKLRLRPSGTQGKGESLPKIWITKSVIDIFADYLAYLVRCAKEFIAELPLGRQVLKSEANVEYVMSHPNAWGGKQQNNMRRAAILAGLVPDTHAGHARVHFVTEGEASLHFCIVNGLTQDIMKVDNHILIVDAGGGTVDLSMYKVLNASPLNIVESSAPDCLLHGSTFVDTLARIMLQEKMRDSRFAHGDYIDLMLSCFEMNTKPTFRDVSKTAYIKFGGPRDTDAGCSIKRGVLSLAGSDIAGLFSPSIDAIKGAIQAQVRNAGCKPSRILLVGGFANNRFLRSQLQHFATSKGMALFCPEVQTAKAVAEGALWHHLDHYVSARIARDIYGTSHLKLYDSSLFDHVNRKDSTIVYADGLMYVPSAFSRIVLRGTLVEEEREFRLPLERCSSQRDTQISAGILCYKGAQDDPQWIDEEADLFSVLCTVHADVNPQTYQRRMGVLGEYFTKEYHVVLLFGLTELKAQLSWKEKVIFDDEDA